MKMALPEKPSAPSDANRGPIHGRPAVVERAGDTRVDSGRSGSEIVAFIEHASDPRACGTIARPWEKSMQTRLVRLVGTLLVLCAVFHATLVRAIDVQEGKHYVRLAQSQPVESGSKIEVIEFFSYACPHCAHFEPLLGPWLKKLPADVQFRRIPALFKPG